MSTKKKTEDRQEGTKAKDESRDHIYYTITPRLVWALSEDPYDLALWMVVKDIAGENGTCILAREDLAALAMMSAGKCTESRDRLLARKLLNGELKRDPGYPQEVWHLSIPDFWEANVRWARMYPTIRSRVAWKIEQKRLKQAEKESSCGDDSRDPSLGDEGMLPGDGGMPLHDVKNNVLEKPKEEIKEEELKDLFLKASELILPEPQKILILESVSRELSAASIALDGPSRLFTVSGLLPGRGEYYDSIYRRSFERAFVGILGEEVSISFMSSGDGSPS